MLTPGNPGNLPVQKRQKKRDPPFVRVPFAYSVAYAAYCA